MDPEEEDGEADEEVAVIMAVEEVEIAKVRENLGQEMGEEVRVDKADQEVVDEVEGARAVGANPMRLGREVTTRRCRGWELVYDSDDIKVTPRVMLITCIRSYI